MSKPFTDQDSLARFIRFNSMMDNPGKRFATFIPPKAYPNELSVFVVSGLKREEIWAFDKQGKAVGYGELTVRDVAEVRAVTGVATLVFDRDDDPPGHASIKGIPDDRKDKRAVAKELAKRAKIVKR